MARLQILELPTEHHGDDMVTPWVLVVDQVPTDEASFETLRRDLGDHREFVERLGARAVLVFEDTIEIPENAPQVVTEVVEEHAGTTEIVYAHERTRLELCDALLVSRDTTWRQLIGHVRLRQRELADVYRKLDEVKAKSDVRVYLGDMEVSSVSSTNAEARDKELSEARQWARHGYEIGQKHCGWTDHGVAPAWLTEGWPNSFDSCEHLKQAAAYDEALSRVRALPERPEVMAVNPEQPNAYMDGYAAGIRAAHAAAQGEGS
ncbi:hypothetical protein [Streptomyces sp. NPDC005799]|uniref:hypothetical protein n=1 Tax=Streptomyces sp. NPDC005799 TaxID=3154678 RepID=UPI0033EE5479